MKKAISIFLLAATLLAACTNTEEQLKKRAAELCRYIPDHELSDEARHYMTADFYNVLDTMFNHLPEHEAMDHEWLYYFVTGNGGTIADYTVTSVEMADKTHAVATLEVRQLWEDETDESETANAIAEDDNVEEHKLYMEKVDGQWLMSDFDGHKADCLRHIELSRQEQALRDAISDYMASEIGQHYLQGELCIPTLMIVAAEEVNDTLALVWCDNWVFWYNVAGDTLKCVSGGNHSGLITLVVRNGKIEVTDFEQTVDGAGNDASARRIFGSHYDIYQNMHSNPEVGEAVRREQLEYYIKRHHLPFLYYQDYGWPAVEIGN